MIDSCYLGRTHRRLQGQGTLLANERSWKVASFEIRQVADSRIFVAGTLDGRAYDLLGIGVLSLDGIVRPGWQVSCQGLRPVKVRGTEFLVEGTGVHILRLPDAVPTRVVFEIANLVINQNPILCNLDDRPVSIRTTRDYDARTNLIQQTKSTEVTCEMTVSLRTSESPIAISEFGDIVTELLTLARGTILSWIRYRTFAKSRVVAEQMRSSVIRPFSRLGMLPVDNDYDLVAFLQSTFSAYHGLRDNWELRKVVNHFTSGKQRDSFLETRGLEAVTVVEHLVGVYLDRFDKRGRYFIQPELFELRIRDVKREVRVALERALPDESPALIKRMLSNTHGLNHVPFPEALGKLCKYFNLFPAQSELTRFKDLRNRLVHQAVFLHDPADNSDPEHRWSEYAFIISFVARLLCAMLNYDGYYHNWELSAVPGGSPGSTRTKMRLGKS